MALSFVDDRFAPLVEAMMVCNVGQIIGVHGLRTGLN
jgi:hypothetical protein